MSPKLCWEQLQDCVVRLDLTSVHRQDESHHVDSPPREISKTEFKKMGFARPRMTLYRVQKQAEEEDKSTGCSVAQLWLCRTLAGNIIRRA